MIQQSDPVFENLKLEMYEMGRADPELTVPFLIECLGYYVSPTATSNYTGKTLTSAVNLIEHVRIMKKHEETKAAWNADPKNQPWEKRLETQQTAKTEREQVKKDAWTATLENRAANREVKAANAVVVETARIAWKDAIAQRSVAITEWNTYVAAKQGEYKQAKIKAGIR